MKNIIIIALFPLFTKAQKVEPIKRTWLMSEYGIKSNTKVCYDEIMKKLIDSAWNLEGRTEFKFSDTGSYHFSTYTDLTKGRHDMWWSFDLPTGAVRFIRCIYLLNESKKKQQN